MSGTTEQSSATHRMETVDKGKGKAVAEDTEEETSDEEMVYLPALLYPTLLFPGAQSQGVGQLITCNVC